MREVWEPVEGYEGLYAVSNFGRVRNLKRQKFVKPYNHYKGYQRVDLYKDGKRKHYKLHRLVAQTFLSNEENKPQVNHKDFNKKNNSISNLEWVTDHENKEHLYEKRRTMLRKL